MFASNIWTSRRVERIDVERRQDARSRVSPTMFGLCEDCATAKTTSSLDQMRNRCVLFLCLLELLPRREPRDRISSGEITTAGQEPSAKSRARGDRERVRSIYED